VKEFDFSSGRTKFSVKFGEDKYICSVPSQSYLMEWGEKVSELKNDDSAVVGENRKKMEEYTNDLFVEMGMPDKLYYQFESEQVQSILDFMGAKKK